MLLTPVALRKESVDRNFNAMQVIVIKMKSLSARRAWIEITVVGVLATLVTSLSARRAWIEIMGRHEKPFRSRKSLSARRAWIEIYLEEGESMRNAGRSPQGERG